jgi:hypothetical protein
MSGRHNHNDDDDDDEHNNNVPARIISGGSGPNYKDQMRDVVADAAGITMTESSTATAGGAAASLVVVDHRYAGKPSFLMPAAAAAEVPPRRSGPGYKDQMQEAPEALEAAARDGAASFLSSDYNEDSNDKKRPAADTAPPSRGGPYLPVAVPVGESIIIEEEQAERLQLAEVAAREAERQKQEAEEKLQKSKKLKLRVAFVMLILLLLGGIAVAAVCGSGQCQADEVPLPSPTTARPTTAPVPATPTPTRSPTPLTPEDRAAVEYLSTVTLTGRNLTYPDRDSPEGLAILWIVDEDEIIQTTLTDELKLKLRQRYVLATLWNQGTNVEKHLFGRWNSLLGECTWANVGCDAATDSIIESLNLTGLGVQGRIPDDLGLLTGLTYLDFSNNQMEGTIPTSLLRLTKLTDLRLYNNGFNGTSFPFCDNNGVNQTSPFNFTNLVTDCDQLDCPCCTHCCGGDDNNTKRALPANWTVQCVA